MTTEKTAAALRVLTAFNQKRHPDPQDVALLKGYSPEHSDLPADELACVVIHEAVELKEHLRTLRARSNGATA